MNGSKRQRNGAKRSKKTVDARKHELADLVRYLARRAAERDYAAMQDIQNDDDGKGVKR